jgi:two-component system, NarL family, nitrate/nitrite response regulator NarL
MSTAVRDAKRVVLCDDHEIVREAIKSRMANSNSVQIVGEAGNGRDVVDVVKELEPDVLIIDVELPKRDGIEATKEVLKARPRTKVIIFTAHAQPDLLALALRAGASGYVLKSARSKRSPVAAPSSAAISPAASRPRSRSCSSCRRASARSSSCSPRD